MSGLLVDVKRRDRAKALSALGARPAPLRPWRPQGRTANGLSVFEVRGAFFDKGGHALFLVVGGKGRVKRPTLKTNALGQRGFKGLVDALFDRS